MNDSKNNNHEAEKKMILGRRMVFLGFFISIIGIIVYCMACFNQDFNEKLGGVLYNNPGSLLYPTLGTVAIGTIFWLIGSLIHLNGAIHSENNE